MEWRALDGGKKEPMEINTEREGFPLTPENSFIKHENILYVRKGENVLDVGVNASHSSTVSAGTE